MSESRHFTNKFPEFDEDNVILDPGTKQLSAEYLRGLGSARDRLLEVLAREEPKHTDWRDVSVYTGVAGHVLLHLHLSHLLDDDTHLHKAEALLGKMVEGTRGRRESFMCGDPGPLAVAALVHHRLHHQDKVHQFIDRIKSMKSKVLQPDSGLPDEILYGRTGYLYALLLLRKQVGAECVEASLVRGVVSAVLESGRTLARREKRSAPLMFQWHDKHYLGAAHGLMGILFMLLQAREHLTEEELNSLVKPTIDYVAKKQFPSGNFPSSLGNDSDRLVHWCHGAPGAVFLFTLAHKVFGEKSYLEVAQRAGQVVWERGLLRKGYGLCHGTAGNGYALLYLSQGGSGEQWVYRAAQFGSWCWQYGQHECRTPDRPMSLFEGLAGTVHFLADLARPDQAAFPAFVL